MLLSTAHIVLHKPPESRNRSTDIFCLFYVIAKDISVIGLMLVLVFIQYTKCYDCRFYTAAFFLSEYASVYGCYENQFFLHWLRFSSTLIRQMQRLCYLTQLWLVTN